MNEDLLIQKVVKFEGDMEEVKADISEIKEKLQGWDNMMKGQDTVIKLLTKMDHELSATNAHNRRVDEKLSLHDTQIFELQQKTGIAKR